jgi:hypothetical protein
MQANDRMRISYGFYSKKHREMSNHWLSKPPRSRLGDNSSQPSNLSHEGLYYVSAEQPCFVEVTTIAQGPDLNTRAYRYDDVVPVGKIFNDSFTPGSTYHSLDENQRHAIIQKYHHNI